MIQDLITEARYAYQASLITVAMAEELADYRVPDSLVAYDAARAMVAICKAELDALLAVQRRRGEP